MKCTKRDRWSICSKDKSPLKESCPSCERYEEQVVERGNRCSGMVEVFKHYDEVPEGEMIDTRNVADDLKVKDFLNPSQIYRVKRRTGKKSDSNSSMMDSALGSPITLPRTGEWILTQCQEPIHSPYLFSLVKTNFTRLCPSHRRSDIDSGQCLTCPKNIEMPISWQPYKEVIRSLTNGSCPNCFTQSHIHRDHPSLMNAYRRTVQEATRISEENSISDMWEPTLGQIGLLVSEAPWVSIAMSNEARMNGDLGEAEYMRQVENLCGYSSDEE